VQFFLKLDWTTKITPLIFVSVIKAGFFFSAIASHLPISKEMLHWQKTTQHRFILIFRIEYLASRTDHRHTPDTGNIQAGSGLPAVRLLNRRIPPIGGRHHIRSKFR
jgi:hypothetical protein